MTRVLSFPIFPCSYRVQRKMYKKVKDAPPELSSIAKGSCQVIQDIIALLTGDFADANGRTRSGIIYCLSRKECEDVAAVLSRVRQGRHKTEYLQVRCVLVSVPVRVAAATAAFGGSPPLPPQLLQLTQVVQLQGHADMFKLYLHMYGSRHFPECVCRAVKLMDDPC
jgi:hypothetical protein